MLAKEPVLPIRPTERAYDFWRIQRSPPWKEVRLSAVPRRARAMISERLGRARTRFVPDHQQEGSNTRHSDAEEDEKKVGKQIKDSWKAEVGR